MAKTISEIETTQANRSHMSRVARRTKQIRLNIDEELLIKDGLDLIKSRAFRSHSQADGEDIVRKVDILLARLD